MNTSKHIVSISIIIVFLQPLYGQVSDSLRQAVLGEHALTLQWLDNSNRGKCGKCQVSEEKGGLKLEGYQGERVEGQRNYLRMTGTIVIRSARELEFKGTIATKVNYINSGKEHIRNGRFTFKAHGKRKYWRIQNGREQPDGDAEVTDYIDIHFRQPAALPQGTTAPDTAKNNH